MGYVLRWIGKIAILCIFFFLWFGGWDVWNALRHANPTSVVLADAAEDIPDHVTLKNITLDLQKAIETPTSGEDRAIYIPVRSPVPQISKFRVVLKVTDPAVLNGTDVTQIRALAAKTEITGMIQSSLNTPKGVTRSFGGKYADIRVLIEGEKPSFGRGMLWLLGAFAAFCAFLGSLFVDRKSSAPASNVLPSRHS